MGVEWHGQAGAPEVDAGDLISSGGQAGVLESGPAVDSSDGPADTVYLAGSDGGPVLLPADGGLFESQFQHDGSDLVILDEDGSRTVVIDYFLSETPADLVTADGKLLAGDLVETLAGPRAPAQLAQADTAAGPAPEIGQVESVTGEVTATGGDGIEVPLAVGSSVYQGDTIETGADSKINIVFLDGTTFSLGADATMVLDELIYDASSKSGNALMSVVTGTFVFITGEIAGSGEDAMQVRTPAGTIGIRGTKVACNLEVAQGGALCVLLPEDDGSVGAFVMQNAGGSAAVNQAYQAVLASGFNAAMVVTQVLPDQLPALFQGILGDIQSTEAGPVVLSSGGEFSDFFGVLLGLIGGLPESETVESVEIEGLPLLESEDETLMGLAVASQFSLSEIPLGGEAGVFNGTLNLSGLPFDSITLLGVVFTANGAPLAPLTSAGEEVVTVVDPDNPNHITGWIGGMDGEQVFDFLLNPESESFTFQLFRPLDHAIAGATGGSDTIEISFLIEVEFIDGTETTVVQAIIPDAGPVTAVSLGNVDEGEVDPPVPALVDETIVEGVVPIIPGADGLDTISLPEVTAFTVGGVEIPLTSGGVPIVLTPTADPTVFEGKAGDEVVFILTFDTTAAGEVAYTFDLEGALDHQLGDDPIIVDFSFDVTDNDGDSVTNHILISVEDGVPTAVDDFAFTPEDTQIAYNVIDPDGGVAGEDGEDNTGADGATLIAVALAPGSAGAGVVGFDPDGTITFTPTAGFEGDAVILYTIRDGDGDESSASLTVTVGEDSEPTVTSGDGTVDESALADGSDGGTIVANGGFDIDTGADELNKVEVQDKDGNWIDVTGGGVVDGKYGTLVVTETDGAYTWVYTLDDNTTDHDGIDQVGAADQVPDAFAVRVSDDDGDTSAADGFIIQVNDDGPTAVDDVAETPEDTAVTVNVIDPDGGAVNEPGEDTKGADGATLVAAALAAGSAGAGSVVFNADGSITFTPAPGFEGDAVIEYTIRDADGDTSTASLTVTVGPDSTPTVTSGDGAVDESALADGSGGGTIIANGAFDIDTGADDLNTVEVQDKDGNWIDVTGGGVVNGQYGDLQVTREADGSYSWTYTLLVSTTDHDGAGLTGTDDQVPDEFSVRVTDDDGDTSPADDFVIQVNDDGPTAVDDTDQATEGGAAVAGNVIAGTGSDGDPDGTDIEGADGATVTSITFRNQFGMLVTLAVPQDGSALEVTTENGGIFSIDMTGDYLYTPPPEGSIRNDVIESIDYTLTDSDGDTSDGTLQIGVEDVLEPLHAFLITNTPNGPQNIELTITQLSDPSANDPTFIVVGDPATESGQTSAIEFDTDDDGIPEGVQFDDNFTHAVILKFVEGAGPINVTDLDLIFDVALGDEADNIFASLLDEGNIKLGTTTGESFDGVIWMVEPSADGDGFDFSVPITYDVAQSSAERGGTFDGTVGIFDSNGSHDSFALDLRLLPENNFEGPAPDGLAAVDISGSHGDEINTLTLSADDVVDFGVQENGQSTLVVLGDNDILVLADPDGWTKTAESQPLANSDQTFDLYVADDGSQLFVDTDVTVFQVQQEAALS